MECIIAIFCYSALVILHLPDIFWTLLFSLITESSIQRIGFVTFQFHGFCHIAGRTFFVTSH